MGPLLIDAYHLYHDHQHINYRQIIHWLIYFLPRAKLMMITQVFSLLREVHQRNPQMTAFPLASVFVGCLFPNEQEKFQIKEFKEECIAVVQSLIEDFPRFAPPGSNDLELLQAACFPAWNNFKMKSAIRVNITLGDLSPKELEAFLRIFATEGETGLMKWGTHWFTRNSTESAP